LFSKQVATRNAQRYIYSIKSRQKLELISIIGLILDILVGLLSLSMLCLLKFDLLFFNLLVILNNFTLNDTEYLISRAKI